MTPNDDRDDGRYERHDDRDDARHGPRGDESEPGRGRFLRSSAETRGVSVVHDWSRETSVVSTIVEAVTELAGHPPGEPLHDRVDPDALEMLFQSTPRGRRREEGRVTFPFAGFDVTVDASGVIYLEER